MYSRNCKPWLILLKNVKYLFQFFFFKNTSNSKKFIVLLYLKNEKFQYVFSPQRVEPVTSSNNVAMAMVQKNAISTQQVGTDGQKKFLVFNLRLKGNNKSSVEM